MTPPPSLGWPAHGAALPPPFPPPSPPLPPKPLHWPNLASVETTYRDRPPLPVNRHCCLRQPSAQFSVHTCLTARMQQCWTDASSMCRPKGFCGLRPLLSPRNSTVLSASVNSVLSHPPCDAFPDAENQRSPCCHWALFPRWAVLLDRAMSL